MHGQNNIIFIPCRFHGRRRDDTGTRLGDDVVLVTCGQ